MNAVMDRLLADFLAPHHRRRTAATDELADD
jgi:hypothetical protein